MLKMGKSNQIAKKMNLSEPKCPNRNLTFLRLCLCLRLRAKIKILTLLIFGKNKINF